MTSSNLTIMMIAICQLSQLTVHKPIFEAFTGLTEQIRDGLEADQSTYKSHLWSPLSSIPAKSFCQN